MRPKAPKTPLEKALDVYRNAIERRAVQGHGVVLTERRCGGAHEIPDAIGWKRSWWSTLVECKTSRADFLRDREKFFRREPSYGMGQVRYYMTPPGLVKPDEVPPGWGLLEVRGARVKVVVAPGPASLDVERCRYELALLYSFARRAQLGVEPTVGCLVPKAESGAPIETAAREEGPA